MESYNYIVTPSPFGELGIVWRETAVRLKVTHPKVARSEVVHIFLPDERIAMQDRVQAAFPGICYASHPTITELSERIQRVFEGHPVTFDLDGLAWEMCSPFQRRVLLAEYEIPRGWVSTYGRIGKHIGVARGGRAVGGALARNPFPIIIPCHRAIRSDGMLGGYQGGLRMKRGLLELEGVAVSEHGKVLSPKLYF